MRLLFFSVILVLGSCTITNRVHRRGFKVEWNKKYSTQNKFDSKNSDSTVRIERKHEKEQFAYEKNDSIITSNEISTDSEQPLGKNKA